jgi:tape measure domain-containing protein
MERLNEKLQGLPTTLQDGAAAVQRLTSANGNVGASTEMFLAMNNAILAGGADMSIQQSAMEQLSQAYAKGKPDMMEWRSAMTAMPAQLRQVAKAMGFVDANALGESLRSGKTSMNDFMETMVKMNNESVAGFKTLEEQARNATGGFATAIANMKSAVTRGITSMVDNINQVLESSGLPKIQEIISGIGKTIEQVLKGIGKVMGQIIKWIAENKDELLKWAKVILEVGIAWSVVSSVVSGLIGIITTITTVIGALGTGLGVVFGAATIGAIMGVAGAIENLFDWFQTLHEETGGDWAKDIEIIFARLRVTITKFSYYWETITANIANAWDTMCLGFTIAFKLVYSTVVIIASGIVGVFETAFNAIAGLYNSVVGQISGQTIDINWNWTKGLFNYGTDVADSINDDTIKANDKIEKRYDDVMKAKSAITKAEEDYKKSRAEIIARKDKTINKPKVKNTDLKNIDTNTKTTAKNTGKISKQLAANGEVLKYIKEYATQKAVNRYTSASIKVDMTNNNNISKDMDIDGVVNKLKGKLEQELASTAEAVHV